MNDRYTEERRVRHTLETATPILNDDCLKNALLILFDLSELRRTLPSA